MVGFIRKRALGLTAGLLAGTAIGAAAIAPALTQSADARPITVQAPRGAPLSFAQLIDQVSPAVVSVNVITSSDSDPEGMEEFFRQFPGFEEYFRRRQEDGGVPTPREGRSLGSGFFISEEGHIVTNNHVIANAKTIEVVLDDGRSLEAELVGTDEQTDLAVLKVVETGTYPYVEFSQNADLKRGEWVVALGNPFGFGGTATAGIVSANGRELRGGGPYTDFIQIDASINRGNSGGPTFDLQGRVVGVNTAIVSPTGGSVGIGFAIPAELASQITNQLIQNGRVSRGWLGVSIQDFDEDMAAAIGQDGLAGAIVSEVVKDSPAEKGGFETGDIIIGINGDDVGGSRDVTRKVGNLIAGSTNQFEILRNNRRTVLSITIDERPDDLDSLPVATGPGDGDEGLDPDAGGDEVLGLNLSSLQPEDRDRLGLSSRETGVVVRGVDRGSELGRMGIERGHAILEVNSNSVATPSDVRRELQEARDAGREQVLLAVRIGQRTSFITVDLPEGD